MATPGTPRAPALITHLANFEWNLRDYEICRATRGPENSAVRPLTLRDWGRPRRGRAFSLELPKGKPQNQWMQFLPWEVWAEVTEDSLRPLRAALGCDQQDPQAAGLFDEYLVDFAHGRLLLRVIRLCHERLIPPGSSSHERQARMDRWLPPSWSYIDADRTLSWLRPTRFASPPVHVEVPPGSSHLLVGRASADLVREELSSEGAVAHWQEDGRVWAFCRSWRSKSARAVD